MDSGKPNTLSAQIHNDATGTMVMRGGSMFSYASPRCEAESKLGSKLAMGKEEGVASVPVTPGKPFTFALTTLNAQGFRGNWGCSVTSTFTPAAGAIYTATLKTANDNATCEMLITDQHNAIVQATSPDYSCNRTVAGIVKNGRRYSHQPAF